MCLIFNVYFNVFEAVVMSVLQQHRSDSSCFLPLQVTADYGPLHPQEQPGRTIPLDVSSDSYLLFEDKKFVVKAFRLFHRIPSFGFCVQEHQRPGRLKTELLKELGECTFYLFSFFLFQKAVQEARMQETWFCPNSTTKTINSFPI